MIKLVQHAQASFGPNRMSCYSKQQVHTGLNVRSLSLEQYTLLTQSMHPDCISPV